MLKRAQVRIQSVADALRRCETDGVLAVSFQESEWHLIIADALKIACTMLETAGGAEHVQHHPLGFDRIRIPSPIQNVRAYINIWCRDDRADYSHDIHNHCYDFLSRCLLGTLRHHVFEVDDRVGGVPVLSLSYRGGSNEFAVEPSKTRWATQSSEYNVGAGMEYTLSQDLLHWVEPIDQVCATLQIQSVYLKQHADVYTASHGPRAPSSITPNTQLREILNLLKVTQGCQ